MYRTLDADRILETVERLKSRISERFPEAGLSKVCGEVQDVAAESKQLCHDVGKPRSIAWWMKGWRPRKLHRWRQRAR